MPQSHEQFNAPRRAFLRSAGCIVALPLLHSLQGESAAESLVPAPRAVWIFLPNGMDMKSWRPTKGRLISPTLEPLAAHKKNLLVFDGFAIEAGKPGPDGAGDHARAAATFLTSARAKKTDGPDIHCGVSVDQVAAKAVGEQTTLPSLQVGTEQGRLAGGCDSGYSCAYSHSISWTDPDTPAGKETSPRRLFERLFGAADAAKDVRARQLEAAQRRSILDWLLDDARSLQRKLATEDRRTLERWLDALRALERRIAADAKTRDSVPDPGLVLRGPGSYTERVDLMYLLTARALAGDQTRLVTFMAGNAGSNRPYPEVEWRDGHHDTSHHGGNAEKLAAIARINRWHMERLAGFLDALEAERNAGESLLQRTLVLAGCGISDGDRHNHDDLPILLAGGSALGVRTGQQRILKPTPLANLHLAMLQKLGVRAGSFADSTGALDLGA
jgi:hypothetical protein